MLSAETLKNKLDCEILVGENLESKSVSGCYIGDLLSWVMGKAKPKDAWLTVIGNINSIAVAKLADISCIILTENAELDADAEQKAKEQEMIVLRTDKNSYECALQISEILKS